MKRALVLASLILMLSGLLGSPALAGLVYGVVYKGTDEAENITFKIISSQDPTRTYTVKTDEHGNYRIALPEGRYKASYKDREDLIRSYPGTKRQDIEFRD